MDPNDSQIGQLVNPLRMVALCAVVVAAVEIIRFAVWLGAVIRFREIPPFFLP